MKLLAAIILFMTFSVSADDNQRLLDDAWANRVIASDQIENKINQLESNFSSLSHRQKVALNNLKAYWLLVIGKVQQSSKITTQIIVENPDPDNVARAKNTLVTTLVFEGKVKESFLLLYELLNNLDSINSDDIKLHILHTAVLRLQYAGIYDKALEISRRYLALSSKKKLYHYPCTALIEVANIELALDNFSQAKTFYLQARKVCQQFNTDVFSGYLDYKLSQLDFDKGDHELAKERLERAYPIIVKAGYLHMRYEVEILLAQVYMKLDQTDKVLGLVQPAFDFSEQQNYWNLKKDSAKVLADYYRKMNQQQKFDHYKNVFRDSSIQLKKQINQRIASYYDAINKR